MTGIDDLKFYEDDIKKLVDSHQDDLNELFNVLEFTEEEKCKFL